MSQKTEPLNTLSSLLDEYKDKKPIDLITAVERSYPISAVIDMMYKFSEYKLNIQKKNVENWLSENTSLEPEKIQELRQWLKNKF